MHQWTNRLIADRSIHQSIPQSVDANRIDPPTLPKHFNNNPIPKEGEKKHGPLEVVSDGDAGRARGVELGDDLRGRRVELFVFWGCIVFLVGWLVY